MRILSCEKNSVRFSEPTVMWIMMPVAIAEKARSPREFYHKERVPNLFISVISGS